MASKEKEVRLFLVRVVDDAIRECCAACTRGPYEGPARKPD
jgi:hypothetical protein